MIYPSSRLDATLLGLCVECVLTHCLSVCAKLMRFFPETCLVACGFIDGILTIPKERLPTLNGFQPRSFFFLLPPPAIVFFFLGTRFFERPVTKPDLLKNLS